MPMLMLLPPPPRCGGLIDRVGACEGLVASTSLLLPPLLWSLTAALLLVLLCKFDVRPLPPTSAPKNGEADPAEERRRECDTDAERVPMLGDRGACMLGLLPCTGGKRGEDCGCGRIRCDDDAVAPGPCCAA